VATFIKGEVVVVPFPFSNLAGAKRRPALVIAVLEGDDLILCQITSQRVRDRYSIEISDEDFNAGGLRQTSNIRPNRLFTADKSIIYYGIGKLNVSKLHEVIGNILEIIKK
jgi:mRNA interferase MazF